MSFKTITPAPARLNRCELAVPGSSVKLCEKAAKSAADVIFLDLEDAVAPDDKPQARKNIVQALQDIDACRPEVSKKCLRGNGAPSPTHRERANRHAPSERSAPTACLPVASLHTLAHSTAIHAPEFRMPGGRPRSSGAYLQHPRCAAGRPKQCSAEPQPSIQEHPNAPAR